MVNHSTRSANGCYAPHAQQICSILETGEESQAATPKTFVPALAPTANAWKVWKNPRPKSTPQTRGPVSGSDAIDYALNALDKLFGVSSDLDAESEHLISRKRKLQADLERVQRELERVESSRSESGIAAHIDNLGRKVKRNAREDDKNAPEQKRMNNVESEFPTVWESVPIKPCMPEQPAEIPLPPPIA